MVDFVIGRPQPESPDYTMLQQDLETPSTLGQAFGSGIMETTGAVLRGLRESQYETGIFGTIGRAISAGGMAEAGQPPEMVAGALQPQPDPVKRSAAEINEAAGAHITDQPMGANLSDLLIDAKKQEIERENIWSRFANAHSWPANLAVGTASFLTDPLNAATLFVPGIGEEALLGRFGVGLAGRIAAGAGSTALGATAAQLPLTALKYGIGQEEGSDYTLRAAFGDLAMNAVGGAVLGAGFGGLRHVLRARGLEAPEGAPRAGEPDLTADASRVLDVPATTQHAALGSATAQLAEGRPVDVEPFVAPRRPPDLIDMLMSRGGVRDEGGELRAMDLNRPQQGKFGILARQSGMSLDDAREIAEEEGFLSLGSDINDLLNAIRETSQGSPRFRPEEAPDWRRYEAARRRGEFEPGGAFDPNELFGEISPADIVDRERQLARDGFAPGMPQSEVDEANAALEEHEAGRAMNTFRTVIEINGDRTVIEGPTKVPEGWVAAEAHAGAEVMTSDDFRRQIRAAGDDLGKASDQLVARVEQALEAGKSVTLHLEGKVIPVTSVVRGMMADAEGQRWGTMALTSAGNRMEIGPGALPGERGARATQITSEPEKATPGAPPMPAEAFEVDAELAEAERRFAEMQGEHPMLPEERAGLEETKAAVEKASLIEQAYQAAANCLIEGGL